jgi:hypothetical protein
MRDKIAVLAWFNDDFQVHNRNFPLQAQVFKRKVVAGWRHGSQVRPSAGHLVRHLVV